MSTYFYTNFYLDGPADALERVVGLLSDEKIFSGDLPFPSGDEDGMWHANGFGCPTDEVCAILSEAARLGVSSDFLITTTDGFVYTEVHTFRPGKAQKSSYMDALVYNPEVAHAWEAASKGKKKAMRTVAAALVGTEPLCVDDYEFDDIDVTGSLAEALVNGGYVPLPSEIPMLKKHAAVLAELEIDKEEDFGIEDLGLRFLALLEAAEISEGVEKAKTKKKKNL